jgi:hypothetical protein
MWREFWRIPRPRADGGMDAGTNIPGVITAGTFLQRGGVVFWDVHNPEKTVVISLRDERYKSLVVEVAHPEAAVRLVSRAIGQ